MKTKLTLLVCACTLALVSCTGNGRGPVRVSDDGPVVLKDYGGSPAVLDIDDYTKANADFRTVLWTGKQLQVTLMSIPRGGEVGLEQHMDIDQFLRIEEGVARVQMGESKDNLAFEVVAEGDYAIMVPAGMWHNLTNIGDEPLKLYSIYAPVEHPFGTVHKTKAEADAIEAAEAERHDTTADEFNREEMTL